MAITHWRGLSADGQTITIRKFDGRFRISNSVSAEWVERNLEKIRIGAVVDVETTGLNQETDRVIEIGVRTFRFHEDAGQLVSVDGTYSGFQDPGFPLSAAITEITGITDEDVRGQSIDWRKVGELLSSCDLIIAHNAAFDRPFIERGIGEAVQKLWGCSFKQVDWNAKGYSVQKLELLSAYHGFFTNAHRALSDADALLHLLSFTDPESGKAYLAELHANARRPLTRIVAAGSPFETKDLLKRKGYRWDVALRVWAKVTYKDLLSTEIEWLEKEVYKGRFAGVTEDVLS